jgi:hypothetical protein
VFGNKVVKKIYGPKEDEVDEFFSMLEELVYTGSQYCRMVMGKTLGKQPLGRSRRRWNGNTEMNGR